MFATSWYDENDKLFFILTLLSLHNYHGDEILLFYCYYVHYSMIATINKLIFIPTLPWSQNCHEKNTAVFFPTESSVFLKNASMIQ